MPYGDDNIAKEVISTKVLPKWCSCCGCLLDEGTEAVRIKTRDGIRVVAKVHLLKWLNSESNEVHKSRFNSPMLPIVYRSLNDIDPEGFRCPECKKEGVNSILLKTIHPERPNDDFYFCNVCNYYVFNLEPGDLT